jgi:hypothetical protein
MTDSVTILAARERRERSYRAGGGVIARCVF